MRLLLSLLRATEIAQLMARLAQEWLAAPCVPFYKPQWWGRAVRVVPNTGES